MLFLTVAIYQGKLSSVSMNATWMTTYMRDGKAIKRRGGTRGPWGGANMSGKLEVWPGKQNIPQFSPHDLGSVGGRQKTGRAKKSLSKVV